MGNCGGKSDPGDIITQPTELPSKSEPDPKQTKKEVSEDKVIVAKELPKENREVRKPESTKPSPEKARQVPAPVVEPSKAAESPAPKREPETMKKASPNLTVNTLAAAATVAAENKALGVSQPPTPQQLAAVQRIQRLARNKSAWKLAEVEREWKVF
jgi:hypothetical protein